MKFTLPSHAQLREKAQRAGANLTRTTVTPNVDAAGKPIHDPIPPEMDSEAGHYNAYRGVEMHGVPATDEWDGGPQGFTDGTIDVHWEHGDPDAHVVPVRIVKDADEDIRTWRVGTTAAPAMGSGAQIIPRNVHRTSLRIKNTSTTAQILYIGEDVNVNPYSSYPLAAGAEITFEHTRSVFAVSSDGNPCPVAYVYEFSERVTVN